MEQETMNIIIDGKQEEILLTIPDDEKEDNRDLLNLEDTIDLSEVIIDE